MTISLLVVIVAAISLVSGHPPNSEYPNNIRETNGHRQVPELLNSDHNLRAMATNAHPRTPDLPKTDFVIREKKTNGHRLAGWGMLDGNTNAKCKVTRTHIRTFRYCFEDPENQRLGINTQEYRGWVREALRQWETCADIQFVEESKCRKGEDFVTISIENTRPFTNVNIDGTRGDGQCNITSSSVHLDFYTFGINIDGYKLTEKQHKANIQMYTLHEFGHLLGFHHEHDRNDAPRCDMKETEPEHAYYYDVSARYDVESIMNYCRPNVHYKPWLSDQDKRSVYDVYRGRDWPACEAATKRWTWSKDDLKGYDLVYAQLHVEETLGEGVCGDYKNHDECGKARCDDIYDSVWCQKTCNLCR